MGKDIFRFRNVPEIYKGYVKSSLIRRRPLFYDMSYQVYGGPTLCTAEDLFCINEVVHGYGAPVLPCSTPEKRFTWRQGRSMEDKVLKGPVPPIHRSHDREYSAGKKVPGSRK